MMELNCLCDIYSGYAFKSFNDTSDGIPVIKIGNILSDGTIELTDCVYTEEVPKEKYYSKKDDIYIALSGATTGKIGVMQTDGLYVINQRVGIIRNKGKIPNDYLKYFLVSKSNQILKEASGCAQPNISPKQISKYDISIQTEEKMLLITQQLKKIEVILQNYRNQIDLLDELVKARFVELFGDENNSRCFDMSTVKKVAEVKVGVVIKPSKYYTDSQNGVKTFRSLNIGDGFIKENEWVYFTEEGNLANSKSILKENDVLVVRSGNPGTSCVVTKKYEGCNAIDVIIARPKLNKVNSLYLSMYTNMPHGKIQIKEGTGGAAQQHFNVAKYNALKLILPPLELQNQFADFVKEVDKSRLEVQKSLKKTQELFDSLMQKYFG